MSEHDDLQPMDFDDIQRREVKVNIGGELYYLVEADGETSRKWKNAQTRQIQMDEGKISSLGNIADTEALLVSLCLFRADVDGNLRREENGNPDPRFRVSEPFVRKWPARIQEQLFDRAKRISGLDEKPTIKGLEKEIERLKKQLDKLRKEEGQEVMEDPTID